MQARIAIYSHWTKTAGDCDALPFTGEAPKYCHTDHQPSKLPISLPLNTCQRPLKYAMLVLLAVTLLLNKMNSKNKLLQIFKLTQLNSNIN